MNSSMAHAFDSKLFTTFFSDGTVTVRDLATGTALSTFNTTYDTHEIVFLSDVKTILCIGDGGFKGPDGFSSCDFTSGKLLSSVNAKTLNSRGRGVSPDGRLLPSTASWQEGTFEPPGLTLPNSDIHVWDTATNTLLGVYGSDTQTCSHSVFSPDRKILAGLFNDGTIKSWDLMIPSKPEAEGSQRVDHGSSSWEIVPSSENTAAALSMCDKICLWDFKSNIVRDLVKQSYRKILRIPKSMNYESYDGRVSFSFSSPPSNLKSMETKGCRKSLFSTEGNWLLTYHLIQAELWETATYPYSNPMDEPPIINI